MILMSNRKQQTKKPVKGVDLDAVNKELLAREAGPFVFTYEGRTWELLNTNLTDFREVEKILSFNMMEQMNYLLGDDEWATFPPITTETLTALIEAYNDHITLPSGDDEEANKDGGGLGESSTSTN